MRDIVTIVVCTCAVSLLGIIAPRAQEGHRIPVVDRPIDGSFEDLFVVGTDTGEEHGILFGLVDVAVAPDGELYVLEERNHRVQVFGSEGEFVRTFGREGQGPGEFQLPMTLAVTSAGEIAVWDFQHRAYLLFDRRGEYLRNVGWGDLGSGPRRDTLRSWPGGGVAYLSTELFREGDPADEIDRGVIVREPLGDTGALEELLVVHHPRRRSREIAGVLSLTNGPRYAPTARWDALPDGRIAVVDGVDYEVRIVDPEEGTETLIERPIEPVPVTDTDRERDRARYRHQLENPAGGVSFGGGGGGGGMTPRQIDRMVAALEFAERLPVVRDLRVDADGRLWIQRHGASVEDDGPIDIVTTDGAYLGTLPAMVMPDAFGPDGLVAWMHGGREVDVEHVVVRRVPPALR